MKKTLFAWIIFAAMIVRCQAENESLYFGTWVRESDTSNGGYYSETYHLSENHAVFYTYQAFDAKKATRRYVYMGQWEMDNKGVRIMLNNDTGDVYLARLEPNGCMRIMIEGASMYNNYIYYPLASWGIKKPILNDIEGSYEPRDKGSILTVGVHSVGNNFLPGVYVFCAEDSTFCVVEISHSDQKKERFILSTLDDDYLVKLVELKTADLVYISGGDVVVCFLRDFFP